LCHYDEGHAVLFVLSLRGEVAMASQALRGARIGAHSMESEEGVQLADRFEAHYACSNGHTNMVPFSVEADVPVVWECRCGAQAILRDANLPEQKGGKPPRTHWDMLLERRTVGELEELLTERLELLRAGKLRRSA
jgi:RNA polymerase-binding protein